MKKPKYAELFEMSIVHKDKVMREILSDVFEVAYDIGVLADKLISNPTFSDWKENKMYIIDCAHHFNRLEALSTKKTKADTRKQLRKTL